MPVGGGGIKKKMENELWELVQIEVTWFTMFWILKGLGS
jgi:hypothetical protein